MKRPTEKSKREFVKLKKKTVHLFKKKNCPKKKFI